MNSIRCHNRCRLVTIQNVKDGETGGFILTKTRVGCADARIKTDKNSQAWVQDSMLQTQSYIDIKTKTKTPKFKMKIEIKTLKNSVSRSKTRVSRILILKTAKTKAIYSQRGSVCSCNRRALSPCSL